MLPVEIPTMTTVDGLFFVLTEAGKLEVVAGASMVIVVDVSALSVLELSVV